MSRTMFPVALAALLCLPAGLLSSRCAAGDATSPAPLPSVPDPLSGENPVHALVSQPVPDAGKSFLDACFKTKLTRVVQEKGVRHEYSRYDPFNKDGAKIVLIRPTGGDLLVYKTGTRPYDREGNLLRTLDMEQPRWDPDDADVLWGFKELQIVTVNSRTGKTTVVKDFAKDATIGPILKAEKDLYRITTKDEGESSRDMRFWALFLQGSQEDYRLRYVFTWDRRADKVLGVYKLSKDEEIDWVGMSWLGKWVLLGADPGKGKISGLTMADKELTKFHRLDYATGHSDVGLDADGNEVIVMQNTRTDYIDLIPIDWKTKPILESGGSYDGTNRTRLVRLFYNSDSPVGLDSGVHVSCNFPGWCVVSTYIEPKAKGGNWLDRSIILVKLDPRKPRAYYLAKVHNTRGAYWEETQAVISNDGSRVVWASNWNQDVGKERDFLMQLDMPANWATLLK